MVFSYYNVYSIYLKIWLNRFYIQNATECTILHPSEKQFSGGVANPRPPTAFSLSRVGMYVKYLNYFWLKAIYHGRNKLHFDWDADDVCIVLDQHAQLEFYSASSQKQYFCGQTCHSTWDTLSPFRVNQSLLLL
jgi:hypothetical protein